MVEMLRRTRCAATAARLDTDQAEGSSDLISPSGNSAGATHSDVRDCPGEAYRSAGDVGQGPGDRTPGDASLNAGPEEARALARSNVSGQPADGRSSKTC